MTAVSPEKEREDVEAVARAIYEIHPCRETGWPGTGEPIRWHYLNLGDQVALKNKAQAAIDLLKSRNRYLRTEK